MMLKALTENLPSKRIAFSKDKVTCLLDTLICTPEIIDTYIYADLRNKSFSTHLSVLCSIPTTIEYYNKKDEKVN